MKATTIGIILVLLPSLGIAEAMPTYIYSEPPAGRFKLTERPDIAREPETAMKGQILAYQGQNRKTNRFCALGLLWADGNTHIPVFWYEKKRLIQWKTVNDKEDIARSMATSKGINYEKDVVDTPEDVGLTYFKVRSDVQELLRDCEKYGEIFTIDPFKSPKICTNQDWCEDKLGWDSSSVLEYIYNTPPAKRFKLTASPYAPYAPETALRAQILRHKSQNEKSNHFCAMVLIFKSGRPIMPIFWYEKKHLIYWDGAEDEDAAITSMAALEGISYDKDVTDTQYDLSGNGSPFLHKRLDMQKLLRDCEKYGEKFTVKPFKAPQPCTDWDLCEDKLGWQPEPLNK